MHTQSVCGFIDPGGNYTLDYPDPTDVANTAGLRGVLRPLGISQRQHPMQIQPLVQPELSLVAVQRLPAHARAVGSSNLPDDGERINVDMSLTLGTLLFASNVPRNTACNIGGYSWLNFLDYRTGLAVAGSTGSNISAYLGESLAVGLSVMRFTFQRARRSGVEPL